MQEEGGVTRTTNRSGGGHAETVQPLPEMPWDEILEPGCYLHLASGLLARIFPDDLDLPRVPGAPPIRMARLSPNPETPLTRLRAIAKAHRYLVNF